MRKLGGIAVLVAALLLAGCSAGTSDAAVETGAADSAARQSIETSAPPTSTPDTGSFGLGDMTPDEFFGKIMDETWVGDARPGDAELISLAQDACAQVTGGTEWRSVTVYPDDAENNRRLVQNAIDVYCPGYR